MNLPPPLWLPGRGALAALFLPAAVLAGCSNECERFSDCEPGFFCDQNEGRCRPRGVNPSPGSTQDSGAVPFPDFGVDAGNEDAGTVRPRADAGDAGASSPIMLSNRTEVVARELQVGPLTERPELVGWLQDRSQARYIVTERQLPLPSGAFCTLREERLESGPGPRRIFVPGIRMGSATNPLNTFRLEGTPSGRYEPTTPPAMPLSTTIPDQITFELLSASPADPTPALSGVGPVLVTVPPPLASLQPPVQNGINLEADNTFTWLAGPSGGALVFEARAGDDGDLRLTCETPDDGEFQLPSSVGREFETRRSARSGVLDVVRVGARTAITPRLGGGQETIDLRVEKGGRYDLL